MSEWSDRYLYTDSNVDLYAPESGGVYRLIYKSDDDYRVFYVGQSDNLHDRLKAHLAPSEPNECIKKYLRDYTCYFRFIEISSQTERDDVEKEEIEKFNPFCNK